MVKRRYARDERRSHPLRNLALVLLLLIIAWFGWVYYQIRATGAGDEARGADAIAVFGAAQYNGRPSPVYHARLDHAVALYRRKIAPVLITLGGSGDPHTSATEGSVGRDYLLANGIPYDHIIAETRSVDTEQQAELLAQIAHDNDLRTVVVVSDPTHLFRIRELCRREGLYVLTSPRPLFGRISAWNQFQRTMHEILAYTALRLHLHIGWLHRWLEGREELW
ncbi:MAG: YdcF family protein [Acidobacteria bacterium]|nr:YdcF family protein [Acidobacteriota bacterium]